MDNGQQRQVLPADRPTLAPVTALEAARVPRVTVGVALRRHWLLFLTPAVILLAIALALGFTRTPTYTAETTVSVGDVSETAASALTGFTSASRAFADTYSRSVGSAEIANPAARRLGIDEEVVRAQVTATPVPESSIIAVAATGGTPENAIDLSNAAARSVVSYSERVSDSQPEGAAIIEEYERATIIQERRRARVRAAREQYESSGSAADNTRLATTAAALDAANLRATTLRSSYELNAQGGGSAARADVVERATGVINDRYSVLGFLLFVALAAGLAIGLALALLVANRQARRLLA